MSESACLEDRDRIHAEALADDGDRVALANAVLLVGEGGSGQDREDQKDGARGGGDPDPARAEPVRRRASGADSQPLGTADRCERPVTWRRVRQQSWHGLPGGVEVDQVQIVVTSRESTSLLISTCHLPDLR